MIRNNFNVEKQTNQLIDWISWWFDQNGKGCSAVIGMSGGKDSTIVAALLVKALGCERVIGVMMPDNNQGLNDADEICKYLNIACIKAPIGDITKAFNNSMILTDDDLWKLNKFSNQSEQNIPPRVRMTMLYAISQTLNGRVVGTTNASEFYIGYLTKYGDGGTDVEPIGNLTVSEVIAIGDYLGIPPKWTHKTPDDGLPHSSPDEEKLGFRYAELDDYVYNGAIIDDVKKEKIFKMHNLNEFKQHMPLMYQPSL